MDALHFVVDSVLTFAVYAFLLRLLLQLARADFRNPLSQAVLTLTNWLVMPLRRVVPAVGRFDTASLLALLFVQLAATLIVDRLFWSGPPHSPGVLAIAALLTLIVTTIWLYIVVIAIFALLSFIAPRTYSPAVGILASLCEPLLTPLRRILPVVAGIDFSPLVAIVLLRALLFLIP